MVFVYRDATALKKEEEEETPKLILRRGDAT